MRRHVCGWITAGLLFTIQAGQSATLGWRGGGDGLYPDATPRTQWSDAEGIAWKTKLPAGANASPILVEDRIFVTAEPDALVCLSAVDGQILWQQSNDYKELLSNEERVAMTEAMPKIKALDQRQNEVGRKLREAEKAAKDNPADPELAKRADELKNERNQVRQESGAFAKYREPATHGVNGYASATPVSDGKRVYVFFGTGVAAAYDLAGKRLWFKAIRRPTNGWGHSASPVLAGGKLILHIADEIIALNPADGERLWSARGGSSWGTPLVFAIGGQAALFTTGGDVVRVADGKIVASRIAKMPWTSPVLNDGMIYVMDADGASALEIPAEMSDQTEFKVRWEAEIKKDRYYASPVIWEGRVYAIHQGGYLTVLNTADGSLAYDQKLDLKGTVYPSITLAGNKLFLGTEKGTLVIAEVGPTYKEVARYEMGKFRSTPLFAGNRMYLRTLDDMYCVEN